MSEGTEFTRMSADEFKHLIATGQGPQRGSAHPRGTRCEADGHKFDSKTEMAFYEYLKEQNLNHIDVHPVYTLTGGIRYTADFVAYEDVPIHVYDVKGRKPDTAFWRMKRLFDAVHPLAPLRVVRRQGQGWREVESSRGWK